MAKARTVLKPIVYEMRGAIWVDWPVIQDGEKLTDDEVVRRSLNKLKEVRPESRNARVATVEEVSDRTFRGAWVASGVDMVQAREIHKEMMRRAREPKLENLDIQYLLADENGDLSLKKEITSKKQELRNVTSLTDISDATTPAELKSIWPDCLK